MRNSLKPFCLPSLSIFSVGSDPIDRKQTMGVRHVDSSNIDSRFRITLSPNWAEKELIRSGSSCAKKLIRTGYIKS